MCDPMRKDITRTIQTACLDPPGRVDIVRATWEVNVETDRSLPVILSQTPGGWVAECPLLVGCRAEAPTCEEALQRVEDIVTERLDGLSFYDWGLPRTYDVVHIPAPASRPSSWHRVHAARSG
jgi:predicted RNase H-like HicB family nuclease